MKNIKLRGYEFISKEEYIELECSKKDSWDKSEIERLTSLLPQYYVFFGKTEINFQPISKSSAAPPIFWIDKLQDEWFTILVKSSILNPIKAEEYEDIEGHHYLNGKRRIKCDQFDAVINYINDNIINQSVSESFKERPSVATAKLRGYEPISTSEYAELEKGEKENFTKIEIDSITTLLPKYEVYHSDIGEIRIKDKSDVFASHFIDKIPDEWFIILLSNHKKIKCDQLDGLINCLQDCNHFGFINSSNF